MSSKRKILFINNETYHIFNKSIAKEDIFINRKELLRSLSLLNFYRFPQRFKYSTYKKLTTRAKESYWKNVSKQIPLIEIFAFSLMPTHYHLLIRQITENGIKKFVSNFQNGFAKYFNKRNDRDGGLFKRPFKATHIPSEEVFAQVMRYIHLNPVTSYLININDLSKYEWCSYNDYINNDKTSFVNIDFALRMFGDIKKLIDFTANQEDYQKSLKEIKKHLFD